MNSLYRLIDAAGNRAAEGLRVLEDLARFVVDDPTLFKEIRTVRHILREILDPYTRNCLENRNSHGDLGLPISRKSQDNARTHLSALVKANAKRAEEALRSLEEAARFSLGREKAGSFEALRFRIYDIEQALFEKLQEQPERRVLPGGLYGITCESCSLGRTNEMVVAAMIEGGIKVIQLREKTKSKREFLEQAKRLRKITADHNVMLIINDDPFTAKLVDANGVHLGQDDYDIRDVRRFLGTEKIIGLSTHNENQARQSLLEPVDYIGIGPIYPTKTKPGREAVGLSYLDFAVKNIPLPMVAIGGITEKNIREVLATGVENVCCVTEITEAEDLIDKIKQLDKIREELSDGQKEL